MQGQFDQENIFTELEQGCSTFDELLNHSQSQRALYWPDDFSISLETWTKRECVPAIRTLSLFTGAGGLDIGFHDAGFQIDTMVEIERRFVNTLVANCVEGGYFSHTEIICTDIRDYHPCMGAIDFVIGGPPCQTFSAAGRRAAGVMGTDDSRGTLFEEYVRIIRNLSPVGFLFENVYGITGAQNGNAWKQISQAFTDAGYKVFFRILNAADYGVPQHRERMFIVGIRDGEYSFPRPLFGPDSPGMMPYYTAGEAVRGVALTDEERNATVGGKMGYLLKNIPPGLNYSFYTEKMGHPQPLFAWRSKFSDYLYKADPAKPTRTIKAQGGQYTGPYHWDSRPFSITELKRLQTFPSRYTIVGKRQIAIHQIGNSVPPQLARILALSILTQVFKIKPPFMLPVISQNVELSFRKHKHSLTQEYRSKAKAAIEAGENERVKQRIRYSYRAELTSDFGWDKTRISSPLTIRASVTKANGSLQVTVKYDNEKEIELTQGFQIRIVSSPRNPWAVPLNAMMLSGSKLDRRLYTSAWKALDRALSEASIKADIVQLNGYYQYVPHMECHMDIQKELVSTEWNVLQKVVEGIGIRRIISSGELCDLWLVNNAELAQIMQFLKDLGYEARNRKTNPQIPVDHYLIPYAFPTFHPLSVQLRKDLFER